MGGGMGEGGAGGAEDTLVLSRFSQLVADLSAFYGGLEAKIGAPNPNVRDTMRHEHVLRNDSACEFETDNYSITTTSTREWQIVAEPHTLKKDDATHELKLVDGEPRSSQVGEEGFRQIMRLEDLRKKMEEKNAELAKLSKIDSLEQEQISIEEVIAGRMYTGPLL